jgi:HK97 family phage major capsid protein
VLKADVAGGGSGSGEWGAELVGIDGRYTGDFIEFLYGMTVFDRLPLRSVPANVTIKGQDGAATGYWVGESKAIPATKPDFSTVNLAPQKVGALAVLSNELLRDSSPSAEQWVRDSLAEASAQRVDGTFLSTSAAVSGVAPAGILNGVTIGASAGATADDLRDDLAGLVQLFIAQKYAMTGLAIVTTPSIAMQLQLLRNGLGQREFPDVSMGGGTLEGFPVYVGHNVGAGDLIMMSTRDIWKIGDGGVSVSISREATIEQADDPTGATDTPVTMQRKFTNMFQAESTAIKVVRSINYAKRRSTAVAYIGDAEYGDPTSI